MLGFGVFAQEWATFYQQSVDQYNNYESEAARQSAEKALELIKSSANAQSKNHTVILRQLSICCFDLGDDAAAVSYAKEEVEMLMTLRENQDVNFANALQNLAVMRMARNEYAAAEPLLEESLKTALNYLTNEDQDIAVIKGNLAICRFQLKKDEEAKQLFQAAVTILSTSDEVGQDYFNIIYNYGLLLLEKGQTSQSLEYFRELESYYVQDKPNEEYGGILIKIGDVLDQQGHFGEALTKYQAAIENFEAMNHTSSDEYQIAKANYSMDLQRTGQFEKAAVSLRNLLESNQELKSSRPATYANMAVNYASLLLTKGEKTEAEKLLREVISIYAEVDLPVDLSRLSALENLSIILLQNGEADSAGLLIDEAKTLATENSLDTRLPGILNQKAKILIYQAKYSDAEKIAKDAQQKALSLFGNEAIQTAYIKNTLASVNSQLGKYPESEKLYQEILPVFEKVYGSNHPEYATVAANYSSLLQLSGNFFTAEYYLRIAEEIKKAAFGTKNQDYLITFENLAVLYLNTARYTEASGLLTEILETKKSILPAGDPSIGYTLSNLAAVKKQLADYAAAENFFKEAVAIYESAYGKQHIFYAGVINNLALLYLKMGNLPAAKPLFEQAMKIFESEIGKQNPDYATALENLATLYQMEENYPQAKKLLEEALLIDEQILGKSHPLYAKTLHNLAAIYEKEENYAEAKKRYQQALDIEKSTFGTMHPSYASTLYNLAALEQELENYGQALQYYQQVVDTRLVILGSNHPDYAFSLYGLASIKHKTGDFEGAKPIYLDVINRYLSTIREHFPALSESEKGAFYSKIKPVFDSYMDYVIDFNMLQKGTESDRNELIASMYDLQLATKALLLNASNKVKNRILNSGDSQLISLFNEWTGLKESIVKAYAMTKEELTRSELNIGSMETKANDLEKQLSLKSTAFAGEFEKQQISWSDVKGKLNPTEVALELVRIKKKMKTDSVLYAGLLVTNNSACPKLIINPNGLQMEKKGFKSYKNFILYKLEDKQSYDLFWKIFDSEIGSETQTLFLSADGVINKVNVATLYNPTTNQYVVDKYKIRLLSNTRELVESDGSKAKSDQAEMFGFPAFNLGSQPDGSNALFNEGEMRSGFGGKVSELPGTLEEVNNIEKILQGGSWTVNKYTVRKASEEQIKSIQSPKILHIATHGFFMEDIKTADNEMGGLSSRNSKFNPLLRSGLLLAGAENTMNHQDIPGEEDGILTAYEAMNLNLDDTDLVVMSACETGLGEVKNGEGVYGLQRSFLVAGASNLVMSLWKVNDATTQLLMSSFYKNWFGGMNRLDAFNAAIAEVRKNYKDPYYWGAFVMLGK